MIGKYLLQNIIGMIISRRIKWARHVARMGQNANGYLVLSG